MENEVADGADVGHVEGLQKAVGKYLIEAEELKDTEEKDGSFSELTFSLLVQLAPVVIIRIIIFYWIVLF